jgi:hypothetical protein
MSEILRDAAPRYRNREEWGPSVGCARAILLPGEASAPAFDFPTGGRQTVRRESGRPAPA